MPVKFRSLFLLLLGSSVYWCFSQHHERDSVMSTYNFADKLYVDADQLSARTDFNDSTAAEQERMSRQSLLLFKQLISKQSSGISDSLLFHCYVKAGLLLHIFDSLPQAKIFYLNAIAIKEKLPAMQDSFLFKPCLFTGNIFYSQNLYDSALIYYKKAEQINNRYNHPLEEAGRLYNRMGAMNYETGNYRLANIYFQKALSVLSVNNPSYNDFLVNYKMNIASIFIKLEEYGKADTLLKAVLALKVNLNEIHHNLGIVDLRTSRYQEALDHFKQVKYEHNGKSVELDYNIAEAFSGLAKKDSASWYIRKAIEQNKELNADKKNPALGLAYKFTADEYAGGNDPADAVRFYQKAICQFYPAFSDTGIYAVPEKISGVFSYIQLFNTLIAKADAFHVLYNKTKNTTDLEASFNAYKSAFALADYVAGTYDSDEARFFLNKIKYTAHDKAISTSIALYELTEKKEYLEEAYLFDQRNKASILSFSLQKNSVKKEAGIPEALSLQQSSLRAAITRLSIKAGAVMDSTLLTNISNQIRDDEIKLAEIQQQIHSNAKYASLLSATQIPSSEKIQEMLDDETALLSYHLGQNELLIFSISKKKFEYIRLATDSNFYNNIRNFVISLHNMNQADRYAGTAAAMNLYQILIKPVLPQIENSKRLIIIPDDELNAVPFEALQNENKKYFLQDFSIAYQYSTGLLQLDESKNSSNIFNTALGFAPFAGENADSGLQRLPYSKEELSQLKGKVFYDSAATKQRFIEYANSYPVVQLATHAAVNDAFPGKSFIAFYPKQKDSADEHFLYADEIYNLRLDSIKLIILSACETGSGKLVQGEGLMSMTRAFAYAGCPNIITSLWRAADKTTAFITQRLHFYLDKGNSKDRSLQLAKIDLLNSNEIPVSLKTPNYWAHLIFIGNYEPASRKLGYWWLLVFPGLAIIAFFLYKKKSRRLGGISENNKIS
ncbi:MAG: CHAT domain-containing tetratricopeptide repeat protein [Ferruginibacter sp.]